MARLQKWYERRLIWVLEVSEVMEILLECIVRDMRSLLAEDWDVGQRAGELVQHFVNSGISLRASGKTK
ncbi:hypothetical protein PG994_002344 [Apiospora phragmitis]|uniref:Uncharacterized protein n=1 Tax=Apiospora phragmitis TaxID=2905665 RepID=A0ABR1WW27_9PEZI